MKAKAIAFLLALIIALLFLGCNRVATEQTNAFASTDISETAAETKLTVNAEWTNGPWQAAYDAFLKNPSNYAEEKPYHAGNYFLADLNGDKTPELILVYYDDVQGGSIFANVYLYNGKVTIAGHKIDMFYYESWRSTNTAFPGIFVEGGRMSTFSCYYWTIKDGEFKSEQLWSDAYNEKKGEMDYKELSFNKQLLDEAKKVTSQYESIEYIEVG